MYIPKFIEFSIDFLIMIKYHINIKLIFFILRITMKKLIIAAAIATSFAAPQAFAQAKNFEGFSVGGNLNVISTTTEIPVGVYRVNGIGQQATNASLQAAYSFAASDVFLLSVGGAYNLGDVDAGAVTTNGSTVTLLLQNGMSLYVEPGFMLNDKNLGYAKVSYNRASAKGQTGATSITQDITGNGFGFGIRTLFSKNLFLQVEVDRIQFGSARLAGEKEDFKSSATMGSLGIGYKF